MRNDYSMYDYGRCQSTSVVWSGLTAAFLEFIITSNLIMGCVFVRYVSQENEQEERPETAPEPEITGAVTKSCVLIM